MNTLLDILIPLFAAAGLLAAALWLFRRMLSPLEAVSLPCCLVFPIQGDAPGLDCTLYALRRLQARGNLPCTLLLADVGLSDRGYAAACALARRTPRTVLCTTAEVCHYLTGDCSTHG